MKAQVISFRCVLSNQVGHVISSTFNQDVITLGQGEFLQGLSEGLQNLKEGEKRRITLSAAEAYGFYDMSLFVEISRKKLTRGADLRVGDQVPILTKGKKLTLFRVVQAKGKMITLDGNHPLAGQDLIFDIEGIQVRDATSEEVAESSPRCLDQFYH